MTSQLGIDLYTLPVALCSASVFASKMAATDSYILLVFRLLLMISMQPFVKTTANIEQ